MTVAPVTQANAVEAACAVAARFAAAVDSDNRFPSEAVEELRRQGLLGLLVPESAGGPGGRLSDACAVARSLGAECLSTALIWAMHSQQVAIMAAHAEEQCGGALAEIARRGALVASATTEPGKSATLRFARAPLEFDGGEAHVDRPSPVVSYGGEADYYLVTMRGDPGGAETDVRYVLLTRGDGYVTGGWDAMGMRGTRSVPMRFETTVPVSQILTEDFRLIAASTAIPAAHLGWTSAWYGAARGALDGFVALLRDGGAGERRRMTSDLFTTRLGDIRLQLDLLESLLDRLIETYEAMRSAGAPPSAFEQPDWAIALNGLKVAGARISHETVDSLVTVAGLARGYLRGDALALERRFRDLRSAALMVNNDELLQLNARRMLLGVPTPT